MGADLRQPCEILASKRAPGECQAAPNSQSPYVRTGHFGRAGAWHRGAVPGTPRGLEQGQVGLDLPRRDLLVVGLPLVLLRLHVVVDVVLGARVAERGAQDVVLGEVTGRVEQ